MPTSQEHHALHSQRRMPVPTVCFWLIGNPVSGQKKGARVIYGIEAELQAYLGHARVRTMTSTTFFTTFCPAATPTPSASPAAYAPSVSMPALRQAVAEMNHTPLDVTTSSAKRDCAEGRSVRGQGNVAAFLILTERAKDGVNVARAVAALNCRSRWQQQPRQQTRASEARATEPWMHLVGVVGGDGSLSDVVNGLCWGTLDTYKTLSKRGSPSMAPSCAPPKEEKRLTGEKEETRENGHSAPAPTSTAFHMNPHCTSASTSGVSCASPITKGPGVAAHRATGAGRQPPPPQPTSSCSESTAATAPLDQGTSAARLRSPSEVGIDIQEGSASDGDEDVVAAAARATHSMDDTSNASQAYYWRLAADKTILRHFLPALLYTPGGTGADFAKLKLCCVNAEQAVAVLAGVVEYFFLQSYPTMQQQERSASTSHAYDDISQRNDLSQGAHDRTAPLPPLPSVRNTDTRAGVSSPASDDTAYDSADTWLLAAVGHANGFVSYEVDIGRITFPKTGHSSFFINECSIGMSCDVVERGEQFKKSRLMTALGGRLLFASSAAISLVLMAPKNIRVARLAPMPELPSSHGSLAAITARRGGDVGDRGKDSAEMKDPNRQHGSPLSPPPREASTAASKTSSYGSKLQAYDGRTIAEAHLPLHLRDAEAAWDVVQVDEAFLQEERQRQRQSLSTARGPTRDGRHQLSHDYYRFYKERSPESKETELNDFYHMPSEAELFPVEGDPTTGELKFDEAAHAEARTSYAAEDVPPFFCEDPVAVRHMLDMPYYPSRWRQHQQDKGTEHSPRSIRSDEIKESPDEEGCGEIGSRPVPNTRASFLGQNRHHGPLRWVYLESSSWAFGNGRWYGGGMHVTPHANPTDGLLSCTNWVATVLPFVSGVVSLYTGRHVKWKSTTALDGERFVVDVGPLPEKALATQKAACEKARRERQRSGSFNGRDADHCCAEDERLSMRMEADGELLEELPAVVELGGVITFFTPQGDLAEQWRACFGQPAPGTTRARTTKDKVDELTTAAPHATASYTDDESLLTCESTTASNGCVSGAIVPHPASLINANKGNNEAPFDGGFVVAVDDGVNSEGSRSASPSPKLYTASDGPVTSSAAETMEGPLTIVSTSGNAKEGWVTRTWRGLKRWLSF